MKDITNKQRIEHERKTPSNKETERESSAVENPPKRTHKSTNSAATI